MKATMDAASVCVTETIVWFRIATHVNRKLSIRSPSVKNVQNPEVAGMTERRKHTQDAARKTFFT